MLELLKIKNLALIENMELEFSEGINVLTGETGAGKSFVLKALSFLLGDKLSTSAVRPGCEKAEVTGLFLCDGEEIIIRRELFSATGRSRLYINDVLSTQSAVRSLAGTLVIHTSQHAQHQLLQGTYQAKLIENKCENAELLLQQEVILRQLRKIREERNATEAKSHDLALKRDLLEMQQQEIAKVAPKPGEEEHLEALRKQAKELVLVQKSYEKALNILYGNESQGLLGQIAELEKSIDDISRSDEDFAEYLQEIIQARRTLTQLSQKVRRSPSVSQDVDLDYIESRLYELAQLKRKLHRTLDEIFELSSEIDENISFLDSCKLDLSHLKTKEMHLVKELKELVDKIIPMRRNAAERFSDELETELYKLGFSEKLKVTVDFSRHEIFPGIYDEQPHILWAPNPGQQPMALEKIASGGELSRFLLALVSSNINKSATLIFDEIEAGIGGITLNRVAEKLINLSKNNQLLLITHWPQLAVHAARHFLIQKNIHDQETYTTCIRLDRGERLKELERMSGGGAQGKAMAQSLMP